ncbi:NYN domain-containing protein [Ruegeria arenilitoris]|uniref:NYN domain-containing protein n=1 Tax=Ruegeria arenilitoris TaxID=1173585 RepID=UPI00147CAE53|nr:hypothetical protein [Ruegeria arenilitoris]
MIRFAFLLIFSLAAVLLSVTAFGPVITFPMLAGVVGSVLAIILLIRTKLRKKANWVVIDGSNVLYWNNEKPDLDSVRIVIDELISEGLEPLIWFDANIGYLVAGRYLDPAKLSKALRFPARRIWVAPKGTPADPLLITDAQKLNARIVSNDRYRDWEQQFPNISQKDVFVRGKIKDNRVEFR